MTRHHNSSCGFVRSLGKKAGKKERTLLSPEIKEKGTINSLQRWRLVLSWECGFCLPIRFQIIRSAPVLCTASGFTEIAYYSHGYKDFQFRLQCDWVEFAWALLCLEYSNESRWMEAAVWFTTWSNTLSKQEVQKTYYRRFGGQSQNQLKPKKLGGIFLKQITWSTLYLGHAFCWQSRYQDMEEGNLTLCLPPLTVSDKLTYPIAVDSINSFRIPTQTKTQQLSRNPSGHQQLTETSEPFILADWTTTRFSVIAGWPGPHPESQSNRPPLINVFLL